MIQLQNPIYSLDLLDLHFDLHELEKKSSVDSKLYQLPDMADFIESDSFCKVFSAWSQEGLYFSFVFSKGTFIGDKIHLGIDTRDIKNVYLIHQFCHLFEVNLLQKPTFFEKTRFRRSDDAHELCLSSDLLCEKEKGMKKESVHLRIPKKCLHGFDPTRFDRMGFFYVIEKKMGAVQNFCMSNRVWEVFEAPNLWQTMHLK